MLKVAVKIFIALSLLLCAGAYPELIVKSDPPEKLELAENWRLSPAGGLQQDGAALSRLGYDDAAWYQIRQMPATVLEILRENDVYPDLYIGKNLRGEVP